MKSVVDKILTIRHHISVKIIIILDDEFYVDGTYIRTELVPEAFLNKKFIFDDG